MKCFSNNSRQTFRDVVVSHNYLLVRQAFFSWLNLLVSWRSRGFRNPLYSSAGRLIAYSDPPCCRNSELKAYGILT